MNDDAVLDMIRTVRLADLGDGMDALGLVNRGTMSSNMPPIRPSISFAGFAYTVKLIPAQDATPACTDVGEYLKRLDEWCSDAYAFMSGLMNGGGKDKVCVIDMGGYPGGVWGSENGMSTMKEGLAGAVIDGGCRDWYECNLENVNAFCTQRTFDHVYGRLRNGGVNVKVDCAGVSVTPGDVICADDDGVLVIPRNRVKDVIEFAIAVLKADQSARAQPYRDLGYEPDHTLGEAGKLM